MSLTPHFTVREMETTSTGIPNHATEDILPKLRALCSAVLEPWRERVGPLRINSGYRGPQVNAAVNGSKTSQHVKGEAADVTPLTMGRREAWGILLRMMDEGLPVDQAIIYEGTTHVHVSHTASRIARRQVLVKTTAGKYEDWATYDGPLK